MRKTTLQEVTCPHCHATQSEPEGVISTNCRACGRYFKLAAKGEQRSSRAPKTTREVFCLKCGAPNLVASAAMSTQCIRCSHYLELGDKVIKGTQVNRLYAYDDVIFAEGCSFKGMEATGRRLEVRGKVFSKLRATAEIVACAGSQLSGELDAPVVRIERGASVKVQTITCTRLQVNGEAQISGRLIAVEIILGDGAAFSGVLTIPDTKLTIDAGVSTHFESITCDEMAVRGKVTLARELTAARVCVESGGTLIVPTLRAGRVEVMPGGTLQASMEKYVPREVPAEKDKVESAPDEKSGKAETEKQAEAA